MNRGRQTLRPWLTTDTACCRLTEVLCGWQRCCVADRGVVSADRGVVWLTEVLWLAEVLCS